MDDPMHKNFNINIFECIEIFQQLSPLSCPGAKM